MVERRPSVLGVVALSVVYWGALAWWQQDTLFGTDSDAQMKAITMFATSFPVSYTHLTLPTNREV